MATRTISNTGGAWNTTGAWVEAQVPTNADDVVATGTSGPVTISTNVVCQSINLTSYTNTLTHNSGQNLTVGGAAAGAGFNFTGSWTYSKGSTTTSAIVFQNTTTSINITTAGKTLGNVTFNAGSATWNLQDTLTSSGAITVTTGTIVTGGNTLTITGNIVQNGGTLTMSSSPVSCAVFTHTAGTATYTSGTLTCTTLTITAGTMTFGSGNITPSGAVNLNGACTTTFGAGNLTGFTTFTCNNSGGSVTFAGGNLTCGTTFAMTSGSFTFGSGTLTCTTFTHTAGTVDFGSGTINGTTYTSTVGNTRTLTLNSANSTWSTAGTAWNVTNNTTFTSTAGTGTITLSGSTATFSGGGLNYHNVTMSGTNATVINGIASVTNSFNGTLNFSGGGAMVLGTTPDTTGMTISSLTVTGAATLTDNFTILFGFTMTGTLTLTGNSATNRLFVASATFGSPITITNNGTNALTKVDLREITGAGTASWNLSAITGKSGDCGGNSGITFTTSSSQTWQTTSGGNWSANAWTTRVPLPQDDVIINQAFSTTQTVTSDMPRLGRNIDWTGSTGTTLKWNFGVNTNTIYGSVTFVNAVVSSGTKALTFENRDARTLTSNGRGFTSPVTLNMIGGTLTQQDAAIWSGALTLQYGTYNANNFNTTSDSLTSNFTTTRTLTMGSGTWTIVTGSNTVVRWDTSVTTGLTLNSNTSTIYFTAAGATSTIFDGGGLTYYNIRNKSGGSGAMVIRSSNTFNKLWQDTVTSATTWTFTAGTTQTITYFDIVGVSGHVVNINSSSAGVQATLSKSSGRVISDYLTIQDSNATGGATWFAGPSAHSTSTSNNNGWTFTGKLFVARDAFAIGHIKTISGLSLDSVKTYN